MKMVGSWLVLEYLNVALVPELLHVGLGWLLDFACVFGILVLDQFLQLLDPDFVEFQLLLFLFQYEQLLLLLQPPLLQLGFDVVDFLLPALLWLLPVSLQLVDLVLHLGYHLHRHYVVGLPLLCFLLPLLYAHLHLLYPTLLRYILLVVFPQDPLVL